MDRKELFSWMVANSRHSAFPFGGYVRDTILGEDPKDLDLWLRTGDLQSFEDAIFDLAERKGLRFQFSSIIPYSKGIIGKRYYLIDQDTRTNISIDIVLKNPNSQILTNGLINQGNIDADVNALYLDGDEVKSYIDKYKVEDILEHLKKKVALVNRRTNPIRVEKLKAKGFVIVNTTEEAEMKINDAQNMVSGSATTTSNEKGFIPQFNSDLKKVAYRQGAKKLSKGVQMGLLLLAKKAFKLDTSQLGVVEYILNQPIGEAIIAYLIGQGLIRIPGIPQNEVIETLSENFRVHGMDLAVDEGINVILPMISDKLIPLVFSTIGAFSSASEGDYTKVLEELAKIEVPNLRIEEEVVPEKDEEVEEEVEALLKKMYNKAA